MYYTERSKKSSLFCETPLVQSSSSVNLSSAVDPLSQVTGSAPKPWVAGRQVFTGLCLYRVTFFSHLRGSTLYLLSLKCLPYYGMLLV